MNARARFLALACAATAALAGPAAPPAVRVTVAADGPGTKVAPQAVGGFNFGNWMPVVDARREVGRVAPSSLRFPAGNFGDDNDLTEDALRAFKAQLGVIGGNPTLVVQTRVFATREGARNRPEDAAAAARAARDLGLKVAYWEIGNEPDLYATNRGDPSWTPERYCRVFRAQREAILKVDPAAKFAGPAVSGAEPRPGEVPRRERFLRDFVRLCGDVVDLLTWHEYPTDGAAGDEAALATAASVTENAARFRALLRDAEANPRGHARDVKLGVTEYGLSWRSNRARHLADQVAALWAAEATLRLAEAGVEVAHYFALLGTGNHGLLDLAAVPRPTLYAFEQLRAARGEALPAATDDPAVWAHARRDGPLLTLLVTNTAPDARMLDAEVPGFALIGAKTFTERTVEDEADFVRLPLGPRADLPARSLTRLVYKRLPAP